MPSAPNARVFVRSRLPGAAALAVLAAVACVPRAPPPDLSLDPVALLAQVRETQARVARVQGQARVHVESPEFTGTVGQFVAAEKPDRLHLEVLDFFGNPVAVMVAGGGRFALWDSRSKTFYRGAPTAANVARIVPLAIRPEDLVTILCGSAPLLSGAPDGAEPGRGIVRLALRAGRVAQRLDVAAGAAIAASRTAADDSASLDLQFEAFHLDEGTRFPHEVTLQARPARVRLELSWREVSLNGALDPRLFRLDPPKGAKIVELPGAEAEAAPVGRPAVPASSGGPDG